MPKYGYHAPLDPKCPEVAKYKIDMLNDKFGEAMGAPLDEFWQDFERIHRSKCKRCQYFGSEHIEGA